MGGGKLDRLPELAADLVRRESPVIVQTGLIAAMAAKEQPRPIPPCFLTTTDPVSSGIRRQFETARAVRHCVTLISVEISSKRLEPARTGYRAAKQWPRWSTAEIRPPSTHINQGNGGRGPRARTQSFVVKCAVNETSTRPSQHWRTRCRRAFLLLPTIFGGIGVGY